MFKDMAYSDVLMDAFKSATVKHEVRNHTQNAKAIKRTWRLTFCYTLTPHSFRKANHCKGDMDVDVKVLSPNNWPVNFPPPACTLPPFAADAFAAYEE